MKAKETAVVLIEFQNEFCKEGGKLYELVSGEIERQGTIENGAKLADAAREKGCLVIHAPFVFDEKWADEKSVCGIIAGAKEGGAFRPGDWGTEFIDEMQPKEGDVVIEGKRALSGFSNTALAEVLEKHGIKNVVCAGFLSNVCVESTARSAYDLGYHVQIAKNATAATSQSNQEYVENELYPVLGGAGTVDEIMGQIEK
jgi:nicotinamidase-related amidase